jgi:hypothetical protein
MPLGPKEMEVYPVDLFLSCLFNVLGFTNALVCNVFSGFSLYVDGIVVN